MTTLSEPIMSGKKNPPEDFMKDYVITGGSEQVEEKLKQFGWTGESPVAAIGIHIDNGVIVNGQVFVSGFKEVGRITANTLWGEPLTQDDYIKV